MASTWDSILTAVGTLVDNATTTTVVVRRTGETLPTDSYPLWLICPASAETNPEQAFTNLDQINYRVAVMYIAAMNRDFTQATLATTLTERQTIRNVLDAQTLSGVSAVYGSDTEYLPPSSYDQGGVTFDVTGFIVTYSTYEVLA